MSLKNCYIIFQPFKQLILSIILLLGSISLFVSCSSNLPIEEMKLKIGEEKNGFYFKDGDLYWLKKRLDFKYLNDEKTIHVKPSPSKKYMSVVKFDIDYGGEDIIIISTKDASIIGSIDGVRNDEIFWDSKEKFAVVSIGWEVQEEIFLFDVEHKKKSQIHIGNLTKNRCEIQWIQNDFSFNNGKDLQFRVKIESNPWSHTENLRCRDRKNYPTYLVTVNLKSLKVDYIEI